MEAGSRAAVVGPTRGDGLAPRIEANPIHAVYVQISKQRIAPAAKGVERHGDRNRYVDANHAYLDVLLKTPCRVAGASEQRSTIGIGISIDQRNRLFERISTHHHK